MSGGFRLTTNNRMELLAVIIALETLKFDGTDVTIYSDSKYVVDAITRAGFLVGRRRDLQKEEPRPLEEVSKDLYKHKVEFVWVKGRRKRIKRSRR